MLLDLSILNGNMSLDFDKYVNTYTVNVTSDITFLDIKYKINEDDDVKIINNENLEYGLNYVFIEVTSNNEKNMYTLEVYRQKEQSVMKYEVVPSKSEDTVNENYPYIIFIVGIIIIIIFFFVIFCPKKSR